MSKKTIKRISLKMPRSLYKAFKDTAVFQSTTMTNLIETYLEQSDIVSTSNCASSEESSFLLEINVNFNIDEKSLGLLTKRAKELCISRSAFLRILISINIANNVVTDIFYVSRPSIAINFLNQLWKQGKLSEIEHYIKNDIESYSTEEAILFGKTKIELGKIKQAFEFIKMLKLRWNTLNRRELLQLISMEADVLVYQRKYSEADKLLDIALAEKFIPSNRSLIAKLLLQKAEIAFIFEDYNKSTEFYIESLVYADPFEDPTHVAEVYIALAGMYSGNYDFETSTIYLNKAKKILETTDNVYYHGWYFNEVAMNESNKGNLKLALEGIKSALDYHKKSGSLMKQYYATGMHAKLCLLNHDMDGAYKGIVKAKEIFNSLGVDSPFTGGRFLQLFIESKHNFHYALRQFEKLAFEKKTTKYSEYILAASRYLYSASENEMMNGELELKKMASDENTILILKSAAQKTLQNKYFSHLR